MSEHYYAWRVVTRVVISIILVMSMTTTLAVVEERSTEQELEEFREGITIDLPFLPEFTAFGLLALYLMGWSVMPFARVIRRGIPKIRRRLEAEQ